MRTIVSTLGNLEITAPDADIWAQERIVLRCKNKTVNNGTVHMYYQLYSAGEYHNVKYRCDKNGMVDIDITDIVRDQYVNTTQRFGYVQLYWQDVAQGDGATVDWNIVGLINPAHVLIPYGEVLSMMREHLADNYGSEYEMMLRIVPPSKMIANYAYADYPVVAELNQFTHQFYEDAKPTMTFDVQYGAEDWDQHQLDGIKSIPFNTEAIYWEFYEDEDTVYTVVGRRITPRECGKDYALIRWVSFTGVERTHVFEVVKKKTSTDGAYSLHTIDNTYNTIKGREDGFTLRIDGLDTYDYWYYSDLITSSRVEMADDETGEWVRLDVLTKDVSIPDGNAGGFKTLEIDVNWRKYDAITM